MLMRLPLLFAACFMALLLAPAAAQTLLPVSESDYSMLRAPADITFQCDADWTYADAGTPVVISHCILGTTPLVAEVIEGPEACDGGRTILRRWSTQDRCTGTTLQVEQEIVIEGRPLEIIGARAAYLSFDDDWNLVPGPDLQVLSCSDYTLTSEEELSVYAPFSPVEPAFPVVTWRATDACGQEVVFEQGWIPDATITILVLYPEVWPVGCDNPFACNYTGPVAYFTENCTFPTTGTACYEGSWWCRGGVEEGAPDLTPPTIVPEAVPAGAQVPAFTVSDNVPLPVEVEWERGTRWNDICGKENAYFAITATDACGNIARDTLDVVEEPWSYITTLPATGAVAMQSEFDAFFTTGLPDEWFLDDWPQNERPPFARGRQSAELFYGLSGAPCTPAGPTGSACTLPPSSPGYWSFDLQQFAILCGSEVLGLDLISVMVEDDVPPVLVVPEPQVLACADDLETGPGTLMFGFQAYDVPFTPFGAVAAATPLAISSVDLNPVFTCPDRGTLTRRWTTCDAAGNCTVVDKPLTVLDTVPPSFAGAPTSVDATSLDGIEAYLANAILPTDGCSDVSTTWTVDTDFESLFCGFMDPTVATGVATDACGNLATHEVALPEITIDIALDLTIILTCTDPFACNYEPLPPGCMFVQDYFCIYPECALPAACNYVPASDAMCVDNSRCVFPSEVCSLPVCTGDFDEDGWVGINDLLDILAAFGTSCAP
jgi:hypothetical protein